MKRVLMALGACAVAFSLGCSGGSSGSGSASSAAPTTSATTASATTIATVAPPSSASTGPVGTSGRLRFLSYNVAGLPQIVSSVTPLRNSPQISPKLNGYDLVLVQEDFYYHASIAGGTTHPYESAPLTQFSTLVNDGLNRFSLSPFILHTRTIWNDRHGVTSHANDALSSKGFSVAIHDLAPGVEVHVWNLHADAGSDAGDLTARARNFNQLAAAIASFSGNAALIVAGDTNLSPSRPGDVAVLTDFLGRVGLTDAARALGHGEHIDRVMVRDSAHLTLTPVLWRHADEFKDASGAPLSDHPALHVDIDWVEIP